jgi:hypothetical protein
MWLVARSATAKLNFFHFIIPRTELPSIVIPRPGPGKIVDFSGWILTQDPSKIKPNFAVGKIDSNYLDCGS